MIPDKKIFVRLTGGVAALILLASIILFLALRASLPRTEGVAPVPGLVANVTVARDSLGIPVIQAESFPDALRTIGFLHAQDRFFQMDLQRRLVAGELAGLFGSRALPTDRRNRLYGSRARAKRYLQELSRDEQALIQAYAQGANAGLKDLGARPPEYLLLRTRPKAWRPEDAVLVWLALSQGLTGSPFDLDVPVMRATLPPELVDFLTPAMTRLDAPLLTAGGEPAYRPMPIPPPDVVDLRSPSADRAAAGIARLPFAPAAGSNAWAVGTSRTEGAGALLANDPHLPDGVPSIAYRIELHVADRSAYGISIPGIPGITMGATRDLAWGATNAWTDQLDRVVVEVDPGDSARYASPSGSRPFQTRTEVIAVKGEDPDTLRVRTTLWGPVTGTDWKGRPLVEVNAARTPGPFASVLRGLLSAKTVEDAIELGQSASGRALILTVADGGGSVGWTLTGHHPDRVGFGGVPASWAHGGTGWRGMVDPERYPADVDSPEARVFHANNRITGPGLFEAIRYTPGHSGERAHRIQTLLGRQDTFDEAAFRAMQLDIRSPRHDFLRDLILRIVEPQDPDSLLAAVRSHVAAWDGTAGVDQVGFRLLVAIEPALFDEVLSPLLAPAREAAPEFRFRWRKAWESMWRIIEERPAHLLPRPHESWRAFLRSIVRDVGVDLERDAETPGLNAPWGEVNRSQYRHPLGGLPIIGTVLNVKRRPMPGFFTTLRNLTPRQTQIMRLVVNPARLDEATLQTPVGQSGHFLSSHYRDMHSAWRAAESVPLIAGPPETSFVLIPTDSSSSGRR